jgi:hypothetical protein
VGFGGLLRKTRLKQTQNPPLPHHAVHGKLGLIASCDHLHELCLINLEIFAKKKKSGAATRISAPAHQINTVPRKETA